MPYVISGYVVRKLRKLSGYIMQAYLASRCKYADKV